MDFKSISKEDIDSFSNDYNGCKLSRVMTDIFFEK